MNSKTCYFFGGSLHGKTRKLPEHVIRHKEPIEVTPQGLDHTPENMTAFDFEYYDEKILRDKSGKEHSIFILNNSGIDPIQVLLEIFTDPSRVSKDEVKHNLLEFARKFAPKENETRNFIGAFISEIGV